LSCAAWLGAEATTWACPAADAVAPSNASTTRSEQRGTHEAGINSSRRTVDRMQVAGGQTANDEPRRSTALIEHHPPPAGSSGLNHPIEDVKG
jgi:hypothetical protein